MPMDLNPSSPLIADGPSVPANLDRPAPSELRPGLPAISLTALASSLKRGLTGPGRPIDVSADDVDRFRLALGEGASSTEVVMPAQVAPFQAAALGSLPDSNKGESQTQSSSLSPVAPAPGAAFPAQMGSSPQTRHLPAGSMADLARYARQRWDISEADQSATPSVTLLPTIEATVQSSEPIPLISQPVTRTDMQASSAATLQRKTADGALPSESAAWQANPNEPLEASQASAQAIQLPVVGMNRQPDPQVVDRPALLQPAPPLLDAGKALIAAQVPRLNVPHEQAAANPPREEMEPTTRPVVIEPLETGQASAQAIQLPVAGMTRQPDSQFVDRPPLSLPAQSLLDVGNVVISAEVPLQYERREQAAANPPREEMEPTARPVVIEPVAALQSSAQAIPLSVAAVIRQPTPQLVDRPPLSQPAPPLLDAGNALIAAQVPQRNVRHEQAVANPPREEMEPTARPVVIEPLETGQASAQAIQLPVVGMNRQPDPQVVGLNLPARFERQSVDGAALKANAQPTALVVDASALRQHPGSVQLPTSQVVRSSKVPTGQTLKDPVVDSSDVELDPLALAVVPFVGSMKASAHQPVDRSAPSSQTDSTVTLPAIVQLQTTKTPDTQPLAIAEARPTLVAQLTPDQPVRSSPDRSDVSATYFRPIEISDALDAGVLKQDTGSAQVLVAQVIRPASIHSEPTNASKTPDDGDAWLDPSVPTVAPMSALVPTPATETVEPSVATGPASPAVTSVVSQVRQALQTLARRDLADAVTMSPDRTMVVRLGPEVAPGVDIQIRPTDDGFDISLVATDPLAREFLEVHQHRIRQAMTGQTVTPLAEDAAVNSTTWSRTESVSALQQAVSDTGSASNSGNLGSGGRDSSGQDSSRRREPEQSAAADESRGAAPSISRQDDRVAEFRLRLGVWPNAAAQG
jgi:hypothetical protein